MAESFLNRIFPLFSQKDQEIIHLSARVAELEAVNKLLEAQNERLLARLAEFELDERETRRGLLTRLGILANPEQIGEKPQGPTPVRKHTLPWSQQAAKLEADSRERYWKKVIENAEKPRNPPVSVDTVEQVDEITQDIEELSK